MVGAYRQSNRKDADVRTLQHQVGDTTVARPQRRLSKGQFAASVVGAVVVGVVQGGCIPGYAASDPSCPPHFFGGPASCPLGIDERIARLGTLRWAQLDQVEDLEAVVAQHPDPVAVA